MGSQLLAPALTANKNFRLEKQEYQF